MGLKKSFFFFWDFISEFLIIVSMCSHVYYMSGDAWKEGGIDATGKHGFIFHNDDNGKWYTLWELFIVGWWIVFLYYQGL